jgi:hypothetical protein
VVPFRCDLATGQLGVAWGAVVEGLVGSDGVVDLAEPVDFDGAGVAVVDGSAVEVLVLVVLPRSVRGYQPYPGQH